jgi:hypothetical protein
VTQPDLQRGEDLARNDVHQLGETTSRPDVMHFTGCWDCT